ncbi:hypothetical protein CUZ56_00484 [Saezia sanguinis]|uniref:Single-stranded DNA-binding protein n=1 Tax=Saezia sanguinis TaxID=1965230 RepID=A0A433SGW5_9BURK|nr:single-stranded DNA-binding protein [Saezia sanguinis]RUS67988.1 hypothetical protein CUZ56_00471 [Saezia sanguinis]RUS68001.1 hypothetical protein CUZ56_00484 [Saezia sanguinis]
MLNVKVLSDAVIKHDGISARTNKPYSFRKQEAYISTFDPKTGKLRPYPQRIEITLGDEQTPYTVGDYQLSPLSLYIDKFGRLNVSPRLEPIRTSNPAAAK